MEHLTEIFNLLMSRPKTLFVRYLYHQINWDNRLIAIVGPRGAGKTTLMLQRIKKDLWREKNALYINADDLYFADNALYDFAATFYRNGGKYLFIDEAHKYENWSKEIKLIHDYFQDMHVVFTGSSILDIYKGSDDLSRRAILYYLNGLSFREYLEYEHKMIFPVYSLSDILSHKVELDGLEHPIPLFKEYLETGYYPFFKQPDYARRLQNVINMTIEMDIMQYADMNAASARKIKHLLYIISRSVPFKPNYSKIAELIGINRNQVRDYVNYLEKAGIIMQLHNHTNGIRALGKAEKLYLQNTNLAYAIGNVNADIGNIRETFFLNQMKSQGEIFTSDSVDFSNGDYHFEIGGKSKKRKQIQHPENTIIVKDDMENGAGNTVPLWQFGFLY